MVRRVTARAGEWAAVICLGLGALLAGCTATWNPRTAGPDIALQWPYQPNPAKIVYLRSLSGFERDSDAGSILRSIVVGAEGGDGNSFLLPVAIATGADGRMAVADMGRRCVHLYVPAEKLYRQLCGDGETRMSSPVAVVFGDDQTLYVSDSAGKVLAFDPRGDLRFSLREAGDVRLQRPTGLTFSPNRKLLYVVDTAAHRVFAYESDGRFAFSFGGRGEAEGRFNFPTHIFRSVSGDLYVTDALNFRIQILDERGKPLGSFGRHGNGSGDLALPKGVAVDGDGVVYVVDGIFDNVQLFNSRGEFLLTLGERGVDFGEFWLPSGISIGNDEELFVCDTYNARVQVFQITEGYVGDGR